MYWCSLLLGAALPLAAMGLDVFLAHSQLRDTCALLVLISLHCLHIVPLDSSPVIYSLITVHFSLKTLSSSFLINLLKIRCSILSHVEVTNLVHGI